MTRINEYYDIMNIENDPSHAFQVDSLPAAIKNGFDTNPFLGFSNGDLTQSTDTIAGKIMSNGINSNISIDDKGNILCYPPNAYVPYWTRIIFRNFDYTIQPQASSAYKDIIGNEYVGQLDFANVMANFEFNLYEGSNEKYSTIPQGSTDTSGAFAFNENIDLKIKSYENVPVFLKFDEYPSRSKVIFSQCDKTRNPDISFTFGYPKGSTEPIKLNLSLSANPPTYNKLDHSSAMKKYNNNLTLDEISKLFKSCYWSIEWQYDPMI